MKKSNRSGEQLYEKRTRKETEPIKEEEENLLWSKGLLGVKNEQTLLYTLYFYIVKMFWLRPCEHRKLRLSNFVIEDNAITYRENISKTCQGGLRDLKK